MGTIRWSAFTGPALAGRYEVWPIRLRTACHRSRAPISSDDPDIILDLQAVFDCRYDSGPYARRLHYRREPAHPLPGEDADWAAALLREGGLRE